jgi:hypothetical protein
MYSGGFGNQGPDWDREADDIRRRAEILREMGHDGPQSRWGIGIALFAVGTVLFVTLLAILLLVLTYNAR